MTNENKIDKSEWGAGAWQDEPDRVDFIAHGFACLALRHPHLGHWCGYVGVPREHPCYGKDYDAVDVGFHGGLTYASACRGDICHTPAPGMPDDVWWLGGDFAHWMDVSPGTKTRGYDESEQYRDLTYVRAEIESLARQLREALL